MIAGTAGVGLEQLIAQGAPLHTIFQSFTEKQWEPRSWCREIGKIGLCVDDVE